MGSKIPVFLIGHNFKYESEAIIKLFIPVEHFDFTLKEENISEFKDKDYIISSMRIKDNFIYLKSSVKYKGNVAEKNQKIEKYNDIDNIDKSSLEYDVCSNLYECLKSVTGINPPWGMMTGIRPVKKAVELLNAGINESDAKEILNKKYHISESKLQLMFDTAKNQIPILENIKRNAVSLYISIPFCPTRCSYCSFVSHSMASALKLIPDYVEYLCKEIEIIAEMVKRYNIKVDTIYFGGGTPTSISAYDIQKVMKTISDNFDMSDVREYNYEAGRADTITEEKLRVIKEYGADRISVNPQTFNDEILRKIGRLHTGEDTVKVYEIARKIGFSNINMDLIAGLPDETAESFKNSLDKTISLMPENITVHTLTLKRSGSLFANGSHYMKSNVSAMVDYSIDKLIANGYNPYYLYRQKNTLDNLENVGYSRKGFENLYNIYIMDESQTILGAGCASSTKLVTSDGKIKRVHNYKFPYEYINRFEKLMEKKEEIEECLKKISSTQL